jgi:hypothetical protein
MTTKVVIKKSSYIVPKDMCVSCSSSNATYSYLFTKLTFIVLVIYNRVRRQKFTFPLCEKCASVFSWYYLGAIIFTVLITLGSLFLVAVWTWNTFESSAATIIGLALVLNMISVFWVIGSALSGLITKIFKRTFKTARVTNEADTGSAVFIFENDRFGQVFQQLNAERSE